jgi:plastocyanin
MKAARLMISVDAARPAALAQKTPRWLLWAAGIALAAGILILPLPLPAAAPVERTIYVEASSFAYNPGRIRDEPGDRVTIELMAMDVVHGIAIDGYGLQVSADPGQAARLTFIADRPGLFRFRCIVPCGAMHPFMIGKLQVGPNLLLIRAVVLTLLSGIFLAIWLRNTSPATN